MSKSKNGCLQFILICVCILAAVQLGFSFSGYRPSLAMFTGEDVLLKSTSNAYELTYPGNWRVYQRVFRGNPYREVALFNGLTDSLIYLDIVPLSFKNQTEAMDWRQDWYCSTVAVLCPSDGELWNMETTQYGDSHYPTASLGITTERGEQYHYRETFVVRDKDLLIIGVTARNRVIFDKLLPSYQDIVASFRVL